MKYLFLIASAWIISAGGLEAVSYYVRSGASGKGDGSNWRDAFQQLPPQLTRGAIYYIASGSYPFYRFERCAGSDYIVIRKATREDHGTDEGWDPAYAEGPAVFAGWEIMTSFVIIDGRTGGGPGNWNSGFGFQVVKTPPDNCGENGDLLRIGADLNDPQSHIEIRHTEFFAAHKDYPMGGISFYGGVSDAVISHCSIHDLFGCPFFFNSCSAVILEYNYIAHTRSTGSFDDFCPDWHTEGISSIGVNRDITIRYNLWDDISGTAVIAGVNVGLAENWKIYGNIFSRSVTPIRYYYDGASNLQVMKGLAFYNNNVVGIPETIGGYGVSQGGIVIDRGEGNRVFNNLWYNNIANSFVIDAEHGYNYFGRNRRVEGCEPEPCDMDEEAAADDLLPQIGLATSPFRLGDGSGDPLAADFSLVRETAPGLALEAEFAQDMLGNRRGADGIWDRGAIEFNGTVDVKDAEHEPSVYCLVQNQPNPFNPQTLIRYYLPLHSGTLEHVVIKIYDLAGRETVVLVDAMQGPGEHVLAWNGRNSAGLPVAGGVYFCRLSVSDCCERTIKMILLK